MAGALLPRLGCSSSDRSRIQAPVPWLRGGLGVARVTSLDLREEASVDGAGRHRQEKGKGSVLGGARGISGKETLPQGLAMIMSGIMGE